MKKLFSTILLVTLLACLCLSVSATQTQPVANDDFAFLAVVASNNMESETLEAGAGDRITLHLYVRVDDPTQRDFLLAYDRNNFTPKDISITDTQGQNDVHFQINTNGTISFHYKYNAPGANSGLFHIASLTFENMAPISETVYTFSLTQDGSALCNPVTVVVRHRHAFGNWETVSLSEDGTKQTQRRICSHCNVKETRTVDYVDYSIALKNDAKNIKYNANKQLLYAIKPGMTVGELIDSLICVGNMQVIDKNGNGMSKNTALATGMTLLVMDEGDGMDANVRFAAAVSVWGDADGDAVITAGDARMVLRYSVGLDTSLTEAQHMAMDADADNNIQAGDARFVLRVSVGLDAFYGIDATSVVLRPTQLELNVGEEGTLVALLFPTETTIRTIRWESSNTDVASVNNGVVTAKKMGTAVITATANSGVKATCTVTVRQVVQSLVCKRVNFYLPESRNFVLDLAQYLTIAPSTITAADATWTSSNPAFTVNKGVVNCTTAYDALTDKKTTVTCTFPCGAKSSFAVTLIPTGKTFCLFNYETIQVNEGEKFKLTGRISSGAQLKLAFDNDNILSLGADNVLTAIAPGVVKVTCEGVDYSETVTVRVKSSSIRVLSVRANNGENDLTVALKNTGRYTLSKVAMTVEGFDSNGNRLVTKSCAIENLEADASKNYVWKNLWSGQPVVNARITQIILTYPDGTTVTLPTGCWNVGE